MINTNRIVPVTKTDLLSLYGAIFNIANITVDAVEAVAPGIFEITDATNALLLAEPANKVDFGEVVAATVYFIAGYGFDGFKAGDSAITISGEVEAGSSTLYKGVLSSGTITITKVGF